MGRVLIHLLGFVLAGCAAFPTSNFCELTANQVAEFEVAIEPILETISTSTISYEPFLADGRYAFRQDGVCWVILSPKGSENTGILDGELSVEIDIANMTFSNLQRITY